MRTPPLKAHAVHVPKRCRQINPTKSGNNNISTWTATATAEEQKQRNGITFDDEAVVISKNRKFNR